MALQTMFGFDNGMGPRLDSVFDAVSDRSAAGGVVQPGSYAVDGLVTADYARNPLSSGFRINISVFDLPAPASELIIGVDVRPLKNPLGGADQIWSGDFLEAGFGNGMSQATYNRKVIASLDQPTGAIGFYQGRTNTNFDWIPWGGPTVFLATTAPGVVVAGENYARYVFRFNLATDTIQVLKNGVQLLLQNGVGMGGGVFNRVGYVRNSLATVDAPVMDNWYCVSTAGGVRTAAIPNARVCTYMPTADAAPNAWVPSAAGAHFLMVNDIDTTPANPQAAIYDQDVTFLSSAVAGDRELFQFTPTVPLQDIFGLQFYAWFKATGGVDASVRLVARSPGAVDYLYGPFAIPNGYALANDATVVYKGVRSPVLEVDPETGLNWTNARLALWKFGFENVTGAAVRATQIAVSKMATPFIVPPGPAIAALSILGTGGSAVAVPYKAACGAPPSKADVCLAGRGELLREINQRVACEMDPPPWREPSERAERFQSINTIALPAVENVDTLVLQWRVPTGYDGVFTAMTNLFNGAGFVNGSGDLIWRIMLDRQWLQDLDQVDVAVGRPSTPLKLKGAGYRVQSHQTIRYFVSLGTGALGRLDPNGRIVCALFGWLYPRGGERAVGSRSGMRMELAAGGGQ